VLAEVLDLFAEDLVDLLVGDVLAAGIRLQAQARARVSATATPRSKVTWALIPAAANCSLVMWGSPPVDQHRPALRYGGRLEDAGAECGEVAVGEGDVQARNEAVVGEELMVDPIEDSPGDRQVDVVEAPDAIRGSWLST